MARLIFAIFWTVLTTGILLRADLGDLNPLERLVLVALPLVGLFLVWSSWLYLRRARSLRTEIVGGTTVYVWTDFNGREERSTKDPRDDWDSDGDGDGDGGGGD